MKILTQQSKSLNYLLHECDDSLERRSKLVAYDRLVLILLLVPHFDFELLLKLQRRLDLVGYVSHLYKDNG